SVIFFALLTFPHIYYFTVCYYFINHDSFLLIEIPSPIGIMEVSYPLWFISHVLKCLILLAIFCNLGDSAFSGLATKPLNNTLSHTISPFSCSNDSDNLKKFSYCALAASIKTKSNEYPVCCRLIK